jgi:predicted amidohydrolase
MITRIACFQGPESQDSANGNLALLGRLAARASDGGAKLIVCPEMFLTGYNIGAGTVGRVAEAIDGASIAAASAIARDNKISVAFGYPERSGLGNTYNSMVFIGSDGKILSRYRKTHLFGKFDRQAFSQGPEEPDVFEWNGMQVGMLICYDVEFPETARILAQFGADLVVVPTALMRPFEIIARSIVPARAYENQVFIAYANRCGREGEYEYCGLSCVVAPDGSDLARAGRHEEMIFADIDPQKLRDSRRVHSHLRDRRPELYGVLVSGAENRSRL